MIIKSAKYILRFLGTLLYAIIIVLWALLSPIYYLARCLTAADISPASRDKDFGTGKDWQSPIRILAQLKEIRLPKW